MLSSTSASAIVIVSVAKTVHVPTVSQQLFAVFPKDPSKIDASYSYDSHHE